MLVQLTNSQGKIKKETKSIHRIKRKVYASKKGKVRSHGVVLSN